MDNELLKDTVLKLKDRIIKTEAGNIQLSETDTRQGLINPLFRALQWDFGDFESIKSELRVPKSNEPVDYAFFSSKKKTDTPILLLEAKRLGSDLAHKNHVKQLTAYLGATGVHLCRALRRSRGRGVGCPRCSSRRRSRAQMRLLRRHAAPRGASCGSPSRSRLPRPDTGARTVSTLMTHRSASRAGARDASARRAAGPRRTGG